MMDDDPCIGSTYSGDPDLLGSPYTTDGEMKLEYKKKVKSCLVCGDNAFYYFYGAITCDSCRTFFRRQILQYKPLKCPFNGNCIINNTTRKDCSKCRLTKCLKVGMRKDLIVNAKEERKRKQSFSLGDHLSPHHMPTSMFGSTNTIPSSVPGYETEYDQYLKYCVNYANAYTLQHNLNSYTPVNMSTNSMQASSSASSPLAGSSSLPSNFANNAFASNRSCFLPCTPVSRINSSESISAVGGDDFTSSMVTGCSQTLHGRSPTYQYELSSSFPNDSRYAFDSSSCDSFALDRSPAAQIVSESDSEAAPLSVSSDPGDTAHLRLADLRLDSPSSPQPFASTSISNEFCAYNWKKRKIQVIEEEETEKENKRQLPHDANSLLFPTPSALASQYPRSNNGIDCPITSFMGRFNPAAAEDESSDSQFNKNVAAKECDCDNESSDLDTRQAKQQRFEEVLNAAARIMKNPDYKLARFDGSCSNQRLEALKWQFFGISKLSRAFQEITAYRKLSDAQKRALLMANCTDILMLSSAKYFNHQSKCWEIHMRLRPPTSASGARALKMPVPVNVMDIGQHRELSQLYLQFMERIDRRWLQDDVLMTLVFIIALFRPNPQLDRKNCHISFEYDCYLSLLIEHLERRLGSKDKARQEFDRIDQMFDKLAEFKDAYENTYVPLDGEEKNLLYTHLTEQLAV